MKSPGDIAYRDLQDRIFGADRFAEFQRIGWEVGDYQFIRLLASWERKHAEHLAKNDSMAPKILDLGEDEFLIYTDDMPLRLLGRAPSPGRFPGDPDFDPIARRLMARYGDAVCAS